MRSQLFVAAASISAVLLAWPVHSQAASEPTRSEGQSPTPPPGVYVAGRDGVTNPRVIRQVKPTYTPEALRARIEGAVIVSCVVQPDGTVGDVRVIKSLDRAFGLDDEAVKAAKQWRFLPGMKDGVAVPVLVSIELNFAMRGRSDSAPPPGWPEAFLANSQTAVAAGEDFADAVLEESGVRIRFSYPKAWALRKGGSDAPWFAAQDITRIIIVSRPRPTPPIPEPLDTAQIERLKETITKSLTAHGSGGQLQGTGQVHAANHFWFWYTLWVPANDPSFPSDAASRLSQIFDGATAWTFMTSIGGEGITVSCYLIRPRGASDAEMNEQARHAGAQFRTMLERMTIELPPTPSGPR